MPVSAPSSIDSDALAGLPHLLGFGDVASAGTAHAIAARRIAAADFAALQPAFEALASRALIANPFMSPAAIGACRASLGDDGLVMLAAERGGQIVGLWALCLARDAWTLGARVLQTPPVPTYSCLAAPVLDAEHAAAALAAMLAHLRAAPDLPKAIRATSWPSALDPLLPASARLTAHESWQRAMMAPPAKIDAERYLKTSMGKALNKRNNRQKELALTGSLAIDALRGEAAVAGFEAFITLEAKGWKGAAGTALAQHAADAAHMRASIAGFAAADRVSIDRLLLDGEPIAIGVVIEAGLHNLFWKAAYDERQARFAPGALLHLAVTRRLFREGRPSLDSGMMEFTSPDLMPWSERAAMARVSIDLGGAAGASLRLGSHLRHGLRQMQRRWR